jgi:hypothetical protein
MHNLNIKTHWNQKLHSKEIDQEFKNYNFIIDRFKLQNAFVIHFQKRLHANRCTYNLNTKKASNQKIINTKLPRISKSTNLLYRKVFFNIQSIFVINYFIPSFTTINTAINIIPLFRCPK